MSRANPLTTGPYNLVTQACALQRTFREIMFLQELTNVDNIIKYARIGMVAVRQVYLSRWLRQRRLSGTFDGRSRARNALLMVAGSGRS